MQRIAFPVLCGVLILCGFGCAQGKPFEAVLVPPSKAIVYVYRPTSGYVGAAVNLQPKCDNVKFGDVQNDGYCFTIITPGRHTISAETESKAEIPFDAVAGRSYFIEATVQMGFWVGEPRLTMVPEETGKLAILSAKYYGKPTDSTAPTAATTPPTAHAPVTPSAAAMHTNNS